MTASGSPPPSSPDAPPDWSTFARAGEWRRALAAAQIVPASPGVTEELGEVVAVQEAVRGRRFSQARRAWVRLDREREVGGEEGLLLLRSLVQPAALGEALTALEGLGRGTGGETEVEALRVRLGPALEHPLTRAEALNTLGVLHALREEPGEARALFGEALAHDPGHYRARTNVGNLDLEAGDFAGAEGHYREALRLSPEYDGAHHNLGVALRRQGKVAESVGSIRRAQRLSVRRAQEDSREERREWRGRGEPGKRGRELRWVLLAAGALLAFLLLRGLGAGA